ncbi:Acetyltransferase (isoleucine patch superfamily) [Marinobacter daqiaonensis]|uniref:Acetyltransferase (Isoleucine patch superfamily) n=1 Tax=Marinobacter daqiaonensis TaxID=650891 RepID=A0A1I6HW15_9GAMM|nr:acyltransferase [Marinobacter daqiaonensis]SFR58619.1 Acetyltransferase (isoleucine patch superfamily) [Marinobacter daqiaonensis]
MNLRTLLKRFVKSLFLILVLPVYAVYRLLSLAGNADGTFQSFSQAFSLIPGKTGIYLRASFYRLACQGTSDEISVGFLTVLSHRNTTISKGVYIGPQCNIGMCSIGENTLIGSGVHVLSGSRQHDFADTGRPIQEQGGHYEKIRIGEDCWLGNGAIVMADIADHCILASGSVLVKHEGVEGAILAGNPARQVRNRFGDDEQLPKDEI